MTTAGLTFNPVLPGWVLVLMALVAGGVVVGAYFRSGLVRENRRLALALAALKGAVLLGLILMLAKPQWVRQQERKEKADLLILLDFSESMNIRDERGDRTRFEVARDLIADRWSSALEEKFQVRLLEFSSFLRPVSSEDLRDQSLADGSSTDIGGGLQQALKSREGRGVAAVILVSDGVHNTGQSPAELAPRLAAQNIPVYAIGLGGDRAYVDVEINGLALPDLVLEKELVTVGVDLTAYGFEGESTPVRLFRRGVSEPAAQLSFSGEAGELLEEKPITLFGKGFRQRVEFSYRPETVGDHSLEVEVGLLSGEAVEANNQASAILSVVKRQLKVLMLEGQPRWGSGMVFRTLRGDVRFRVDSVTQLGSQEALFLPIGAGFRDREAWGEDPFARLYPLDPPFESYDCVILGDIHPGLFVEGSLERLARRVEEDGLALVFLAGEETFHAQAWGSSPLASLLPVVLESTPVYQEVSTPFVPTLAGQQHPVLNLTGSPALTGELWRQVPAACGFFKAQQVRPGAVALAEHPAERNRHGNYPLAAFQRVGKGRVLALMVEDAWLWALDPGQAVRKCQVFPRFWRGAVRYLVSGRREDELEGISLLLGRSKVARGEEFLLRSKAQAGESFEELDVVYELTSPDGLTDSLQPAPEPSEDPRSGLFYSLPVRLQQIGEYQIVARLLRGQTPVAEDKATFTVEPAAFEHRNAGLNATLLQSLAGATGGRYYTSQTAQRLPQDLPPSERTVTVRRKIELWNSLALFMAVVLLMNAEWVVRRWKDLS